jgi:hypothetical protein
MHRALTVGGSCVFVALTVVMLPGCPSDKLATVSGTVSFKGKPLTGGTILFLSEDKTKQELAPIGVDGAYTSSRVPWGKVLIGVQPVARDVMPAGAIDLSKLPKDQPGTENYGKKEQGKYVDIPTYLYAPDTSNLTLNVDQSHITHNISLPTK